MKIFGKYKSFLSIIFFFMNEAMSRTQIMTSERLLLVKNSRFRPMVAKTFELVYVTFPGYPEPKIKIESEKINELCEIPFPFMYDAEYPIGVDSLANGKLILSLLVAKRIFDRRVLTLIINLENCKYESTVIDLDVPSPNNNDYRESVRIIGGENEFDVFLTKHITCSAGKACRLRYTDNGKYVASSDLEFYPENATDWFVDSIAEKDLSLGYFYTVLTANETFLMKIDMNLMVKKKLLLDKTFLYSGTYAAVNRCRGVSKYQLECQLFGEDLTSPIVASIDSQSYKNYLRGVKLFNLADGTALIVLILQVYSEPIDKVNFSTYIDHVNSYGRSTGPTKFQDDICKDYDNIVITSLKNNFYCISVSCRDSIRTKCVRFMI